MAIDAKLVSPKSSARTACASTASVGGRHGSLCGARLVTHRKRFRRQLGIGINQQLLHSRVANAPRQVLPANPVRIDNGADRQGRPAGTYLTCCVSLSFSRSPCFRLCTPFGSFGDLILPSETSRRRIGEIVDLHEGRLGEAQRRRRRQNWSSRWWPMLCHSSPMLRSGRFGCLTPSRHFASRRRRGW